MLPHGGVQQWRGTLTSAAEDVDHPGMHHGRLHQKLIAFAAASAIVWSAWPLAADTYPRQPGIDARHYTVRLTLLTGDSNEIQAEVAVTLRVAAAGTREAILDLTSATPDGKGMTVTGVTPAAPRCRSSTATIGCTCRYRRKRRPGRT